MASRYPQELLAEAVATSRTMSEVLARFGAEQSGGTRKYVRERIRALGIDASHLKREGGRWTREVLADAVAESSNMNDVLRRLGVDVVGGQHTHISRRVRALGIDTSHFVAQGRRSPGARRRRRAADLLVKQQASSRRRTPGEQLKRALLSMGTEERCALCGVPPCWLGRPLRLEIDHVNGDFMDDRSANLRLLCPNCHATTDTYRRRRR
jgi:hypothetical protein